jgi:hypothetical protein
MTSASRVPVVHLLLLGALFFAATSWAQNRPPISEQIAKTYGLDSFSQIERIRYTFNVPEFKLSRTWVWEPKTDQVSYEGKDKAGNPLKLTYQRSQLSSQPAVVKDEIDPAFINDQYWLLFPLHLVWDSSATVEDTGMHKLLLGKGSARRVVVTYPPDGYSPGDTWELFVGTDNRIREWVYNHGGSPKWTGVWSWEDHKRAGPLLVSLNHPGRGMDGKPVRVFFSDVAVKLVGDANTWVKAR